MAQEDFLEAMSGSADKGRDPIEAARRGAKRVLPRRFWREVTVVEREGGFAVALDGRPARTPGRHELAVPSRRICEALAAEWQALDAEIDPAGMPLTRLVVAAIDAVSVAPLPVAAEIVKYGGSDLLCYREAVNERLAARQAAHWDAPLAHMRDVHGLRFRLAAGVTFITQPAETIAGIERAVARHSSPLELAALHSATTLTGSAILALALAAGEITPDAVWAAAHVDEDFQMEAWGQDAEALQRRSAGRAEFDAAAYVLGVLASDHRGRANGE